MTLKIKIRKLRYQKAALNENGFSLIEVLISVGIMGIISMGIASSFSQQQNEMKALSEKFDIQSLNHIVLTMLQSSAACKANLSIGASPIDISDATTTSPSANSIDLSELHIGPTAATALIAKTGQSLPGKPNGRMTVLSIKIKAITQTGVPNEYKGSLTIEFDPTSMVRSLKPVSIDKIFTIVTPASAAVVDNCGSSGPIVSTIIEPKCEYLTTAAPSSYACVPPSCPGGWTDLGIISKSVEANSGGQSGGYMSRYCIL